MAEKLVEVCDRAVVERDFTSIAEVAPQSGAPALHNPETEGDTLRPKMRVRTAIVGANGFVGRHLMALLAREGRAMLGVVRSAEGARLVRELGGVPFQVRDLERPSTDELGPALADCAGLVYTASASAGPGSADRTDPTGLVNVIQACRDQGVPRILFLSGLGVAHYGMNSHCTNAYFLSKMAGEVALFRSDRAVTVFRPSYIVGEGDEFLSPLVRRMADAAGLEIPGDGAYRLQPISVQDAARAILAALDEEPASSARVVDLVGPEILSYRALIGRVASLMGRRVDIRERPMDEALAQARESDYFGLRPLDLACLLCDEVSDPRPVEALIGGGLETVDAMVGRTIAAFRAAERVG